MPRSVAALPGLFRWCASEFLDEAPEFGKGALEALRQPLESGLVRVARTRGVVEYPARTQLVLAANPCPCAKPSGDVDCECAPLARRRYLGRLSGPLLDRVDVLVTLPAMRAAELLHTDTPHESSATVAARVAVARRAAADRWAATGHRVNAEVPGPYLRRPPWHLPARVTRELRRRLDTGSLSARGYDRVLRLAWTVADLDGRDRPDQGDVAEAIHLRTGEGA
ncbi:Magnesium chelatase, subunit ChlI C-terminal [Micromonospora sediminicola]|uniref:Magnesium chelatase, subunit ChlI C-terminal n=1 Tax=Micromonospora sediminicola TaxID=946078 RepID=A0A1A9BGY2_9ACTN|nr:Magnesium chelatase, subunit ChlI C-terminal [Micromonospora sediminicola]